jgi:hypothetical protein
VATEGFHLLGTVPTVSRCDNPFAPQSDLFSDLSRLLVDQYGNPGILGVSHHNRNPCGIPGDAADFTETEVHVEEIPAEHRGNPLVVIAFAQPR